MGHLSHLPTWCDANRLLLAVEEAVGQFPRYHKYAPGTDLRRQAMAVCRLILRAAQQGKDQSYAFVTEEGYLPRGMKRRLLLDLLLSPGSALTGIPSHAACSACRTD